MAARYLGWIERPGWAFNTSYSVAQETGESEKLGNDTELTAAFTQLEFYRVSAGDWRDWPDNTCLYNEASDYDYHRVSATFYRINTDPGAC